MTVMKRTALVAFVVLAIAPFAYLATMSSFWDLRHSIASETTVLYLLLLAAVVVWGHRWAWVLLALLYGSVVIAWAFDSHRFRTSHLLDEIGSLVVLGLFVSPVVRGKLTRPVGRTR
jgi:hypothetical protein